MNELAEQKQTEDEGRENGQKVNKGAEGTRAASPAADAAVSASPAADAAVSASPAARAWKLAVEQAALDKPEGPVPMVSICCITFNHGDYIRETLEGFLSQKTDFPIEILIHDDASTDNTQQIIREYADRYPTVIRPILRTENQYSKGISNISVFNFPRARGRYIAMCEGDDCWIDPAKLQAQVDYLEAHPDCALCFHSARICTVDGSMAGGRMRPYTGDRIVQPEDIVDKTSGYPTASLTFPAEIVKHLPDYYLDCPVGDIPMQLMMACEGYGYYMDRDMCIYRVGVASSWTSLMKQGDYEKKQKRYYEEMRDMYQAFDRASGGRFHRQAVRAADRIYFLTQVNTKHYGQVMRSEYREFYKELDLRTRFFIRFEILAPWLYRGLQRLVRGRN